jgi:hypothetical protein
MAVSNQPGAGHDDERLFVARVRGLLLDELGGRASALARVQLGEYGELAGGRPRSPAC